MPLALHALAMAVRNRSAIQPGRSGASRFLSSLGGSSGGLVGVARVVHLFGADPTGVPLFSPHALRRRRGSLLEKQGHSLAEVGAVIGDTKTITAEHYVFALGDYREVDRERLLR